jgi:hypothetical protein
MSRLHTFSSSATEKLDYSTERQAAHHIVSILAIDFDILPGNIVNSLFVASKNIHEGKGFFKGMLFA